MTSNRDRAAEIIYRTLNPKYGDFSHHEETADALAAAGVLAPDEGFRTAYGVWSVSPNPNGAEDYHWCRDESRDTATTMVRNLRAAGWEAEVIARHVSGPRFITRTAAAHAQKEETNE